MLIWYFQIILQSNEWSEIHRVGGSIVGPLHFMYSQWKSIFCQHSTQERYFHFHSTGMWILLFSSNLVQPASYWFFSCRQLWTLVCHSVFWVFWVYAVRVHPYVAILECGHHLSQDLFVPPAALPASHHCQCGRASKVFIFKKSSPQDSQLDWVEMEEQTPRATATQPWTWTRTL